MSTITLNQFETLKKIANEINAEIAAYNDDNDIVHQVIRVTASINEDENTAFLDITTFRTHSAAAETLAHNAIADLGKKLIGAGIPDTIEHSGDCSEGYNFTGYYTLAKTTTKKSKIERITAALYMQGIPLFTRKSCYPENDAPQNLRGRTHYVDADTLKHFSARVLNAGHSENGLLYWIVESVNSRPTNGGYTRRAVIFDVFGEVLADRDNWHKVTGKAVDEALQFVRSFDAVKHTAQKLQDRAKRDIARAKETVKTLRGR